MVHNFWNTSQNKIISVVTPWIENIVCENWLRIDWAIGEINTLVNIYNISFLTGSPLSDVHHWRSGNLEKSFNISTHELFAPPARQAGDKCGQWCDVQGCQPINWWLPCKAKRQYLLTLQKSRYCFFGFAEQITDGCRWHPHPAGWRPAMSTLI